MEQTIRVRKEIAMADFFEIDFFDSWLIGSVADVSDALAPHSHHKSFWKNWSEEWSFAEPVLSEESHLHNFGLMFHHGK